MKPVVTVFVKTLGRSPLKTRLAKEIGEARAHRFYELCVSAIEAEIKHQADLGKCVGAWAVAEADAESVWHGFPVINQGRGALGERLQRVYDAQQAQHGVCVLMAADSPQISRMIMARLWQALGDADFVIGPALDGGFYLVAGKCPVPAGFWSQITYSQPDTLVQLRCGLDQLGVSAELPCLSDVDYASDLAILHRDLIALEDKSNEQKILQIWVEDILALLPPRPA